MKDKYTNLIIDGKMYKDINEIVQASGLKYNTIYNFICTNQIKKLVDAMLYRRMHTYTPIEGEIWKDIPGYEDRYRVSNKGRVLRLYDGAGNYSPLLIGYDFLQDIKRRHANSTIYRAIKLPASNKDKEKHKYSGGKRYNIHRLVAQLFIPNPNNYPEVNHKNGDGRDNRVENLEWCTKHDNILHARRVLKRGIPDIRGEKNHLAKLTWDIVKQIRKEYAEDFNLDYVMLSKKYNINKDSIGRIIRNTSWIDSDYIPPEKSHYYIKMGITTKKKCLNRKVKYGTIPIDIIRKIREDYSTHTITQVELAKKYNTTRAIVCAVINYSGGYGKLI